MEAADTTPLGTNLFRHSTDFRPIAAGDTLFEAGAPGATMFVVKDGGIDLLIDGHVVDTVGPTGILGEMALVSEVHTRSATAVAKVDSEVVEVDQREFMFLIERSPFFAIEVMRVMARRIRQLDAIAYPPG